ncbi:hypothetical protein CP532_2401 [Ophiocordyceps camponoti-leonardi (nom. inval.)]|nr:hypothetical protein CP532_2401 [Ophiocordyceps camponoti-leonardi (nom. inval.)]
MESPRKPSLDLEKELTCSICTELLYQPLTLLDCLHTFCGACLKEWFGFQALTTAPFTCPSCRSAVRGSRHNATVVTLLDMLVAAQPGKARSQADKEEMARKYQPGDEVPPKVTAGRESKKHDGDDDDRLLEQVREMSLREVMTPRRRNGRNGRSQEDEDREEEEQRRRRVEHQSSLRSLIGSAERDIEREIEDFARQIQEEGLLDGLDLDNIDLSRDDELSRRVTEAYRRRQQRRGRSQRQDEAVARRHRATSSSNNRSRPPSASLEVRGARSRRRTASGGRSATAPLLSVGGATQQAARSQTELVSSRLDVPAAAAAAARDQRRSSSTPSVAAFSPPGGGGGESNASFASRAPQWNPATDSRTDPQPVSRNRPPLFPEPSISCSRCSRQHIEYDLHYSCALCAGGQWTVCLDCYRAAKGCLHWFGFGHGAWIKWDKAHQLDPTTARPHVLTPSRYLRPPSTPGGADGRRTLTWHDPRTRFETGTFCARCLARANECYWRCDVCNDGDWGFCTDCVNGGFSCSHMLLPLVYEPAHAQQQEQQQDHQTPNQAMPSLRRQWTGRPQSSLGPFKPLPVYSDAVCAVCEESMAASQVRYHCFTCSKGDYDVCTRCYSSLETQGKISAENGASGWRRCLGGHRMAVVGWASGKVGRWRYVEREPVGGRSLVEGGGGNADDGTELWSWPSGSETRRRRVTVDVAASTGVVGASVGFPPDGGMGLRAQARWAWYPAAEADDELLFPRGAEVREVEDVNGDWFFGVYMGAKGLFPAPYIMFRHSARRLTQQSVNACLGGGVSVANRVAVSHAQGITPGFTGAIGNTPLIRLKHLSEETGCTILGKAEFMNPGGSVKDRAALWIVREAEKRGELSEAGTVVEGTAGNTGIGLAHVCRARGYKLVIYMPDTQSRAKVDLLRLLGAEVYPVPAVPWDNEENYNHQARRHAARVRGAVWTDQFDNVANRQAHIESTGPEIWAQTGGKLDAFVCATGTGGTLAGVTRFLKEKSGGAVKCYLADPPGSVLYSVITSEGKSKERTGTGSITEGIGQGRVTENLKPDLDLLDGAFHVPDEETIAMVYRCLDEEGLYLGASTALNVVAARDVARKLGPGHTVVTILCDGAYRYADRLFSRSWLAEKKLLDAIPKPLQRYIALP